MRALAGSDLLALWERGAQRHALDRCALLAAAAAPEGAAPAVADLPLGAVTARLLRLRHASFGPLLAGHADCPHCGERLAFSLDLRQLLPDPHEDENEDAPAPRAVTVAGLRVRSPSLRDLAAVAGQAAEADADRAVRALLVRCTLAGDASQLDAAALRAVEDALDTLDPLADLLLALDCAACGQASQIQLDAGAWLWDEVDARAHALLDEVHRLASAYGWSEAQILALGPARRASYLARVGA